MLRQRQPGAWIGRPCATGRSWPKGSSGVADGRPAEGHRYNADGIAGPTDQPRSGRPPALTPEQMQELRDLVLAGPDPERDGVVRWRCVDLRGEIAERFTVDVHERTVGKLLHKLGMVRLQPRPYHPKKDAAAQETFKKTSPRV